MAYSEKYLFRDRVDAGRQLAKKLEQYRNTGVIVTAIPRGGVPVAIEVAVQLDATLDVVVVRKIPIPHNPEVGFGAVTEDHTVVLNQPMVQGLGLNDSQIRLQVQTVPAEIERRSALYREKLLTPVVKGKTVIIVDDGLASGYTMIAAIHSVRKRQPSRIVVAVPVASRMAYETVKPIPDELVSLMVANTGSFAVASYYHQWSDLTDEDILKYLDYWAKKQAGTA